jgi:hypothetical protein
MDGIAMASPLSPAFANFVMEDKDLALSRTAYKPTFWFHYMDNTFAVWPHGPEIQ